MRCDACFDKKGYVVKIRNSLKGEYDLPDDADPAFLNCYFLKDGILILDEQKKAEALSRDIIRDQIEDLKKKLSETDYIISRTFEEVMSLNNPLTLAADLIKIIARNSKQYQESLVQRKAWREKIEELKEELNG